MSADLASEVTRALCDHGVVDTGSRERVETELRAAGATCLGETAGLMLLAGVPGVPLSSQQRVLGVRLGVWPATAVSKRRVSLLSSRIGRKLDQQPEFFHALKAVLTELNPDDDVLMQASGTTCSRFVDRAEALFGLQTIRVEESTVGWRRFFAAADEQADCRRILLSVPVVACSTEPSLPIGDRVLSCLANEIRVLSLRRRGNTMAVLRDRLSDHAFPPASVVTTALGHAEALRELEGLGAASWKPPTDLPLQQEPSAAVDQPQTLSEPPFADYLLHWTRRPDGPWPDETEADYLDGLILGIRPEQRSAFSALRRIVSTEKLFASGRLIRESIPVVCFSETSVASLPERRTYRPHLRRWDCEPYGIAIRKSWLQARGAREVTYGEAGDTSAVQSAFFQPAAAAGGTDWRSEREWRCVGDVDLSTLGETDAFVFCASEAEAAELGPLCRWPILVPGTLSD